MKKSDTRFLTSHTGSLPHPPFVTRLFLDRLAGDSIDEAELARLGREAVAATVAKQIECGIDVINNGEQQRESFVLFMRRRLSGLGSGGQRKSAADLDKYPDFQAMQARLKGKTESVKNTEDLPAAIADIGYVGSRYVEEECSDFAEALRPHQGEYVEAFYTAPSPGIVSTIVENRHYADMESYLGDISAAMRVEFQAIHEHGYVLQVDCPDLAMERHMAFRDASLQDYLRFVEMVVHFINEATSGIPRDRVRVHVCWGNYEGPHDEDVALKDVLPRLAELNAGAFVLPFANPRHAHEFTLMSGQAAFRDRIVIAGVIDTLTNVVEHPEVVADRLERFAAALGDPTRIMAGTDCGFDTSAGNSRVAPDVAWAKLRSLVEGARIASSRVFK